jgi:hypothetical protein
MPSGLSTATPAIAQVAGVTLKWEAPPQAQIDEAVAAAKASDIVLAFVGLSHQLEGEEMPIKIEGFDGGDRTSIDLPASQRHLLEAVAAAGKPIVVVALSGSALALASSLSRPPYSNYSSRFDVYPLNRDEIRSGTLYLLTLKTLGYENRVDQRTSEGCAPGERGGRSIPALQSS